MVEIVIFIRYVQCVKKNITIKNKNKNSFFYFTIYKIVEN